ncbi:flagellar assembly protein A [Campylobacter sp.]|uniref:flagellar assembly protein A n=1 Tax=Campylobacter sp. TaxID=205 RepID=UPI002707DCAE|nr:FapA family protein [Campylobacter sp.]
MQNIQTNEPIYLDPMIIQTPNPYAEISNLSTNFNVEAKFIDFNIVEIFTEYKLLGDSEIKVIEGEKLEIFDDDKFYINQVENIKQTYKVEFFDVRRNKPKLLPNISLNVNKNLTKVIATVSRSNDVVYFKEFEAKMREFIYKKLIKVGILAGIRNQVMRAELSKISSTLRINEIIDRDYTFVVTSGIDKVESIDDAIIYHYKNKVKNADSQGKIDYANRGYLLGVGENELVFEYVKSYNGEAGRDVRGNLLPVNQPKTGVSKMIQHSDNIEAIEDEKGIKYYSKKAGYVCEEKGAFDIKEQLDVNEISFRTTGSIDTGLDNKVTLNVKESDVTKDAIGAGMNVEANEINIHGNVAQNATIKANKVTIGGQTHAKSHIEAKEAKIAVHIGSFDGDHVEIDRLENGRVKAKTAVIRSILGGEVIAERLEVGVLASNSSIIIADTLEIKQLRGTNNKILVDFSMVKNSGDKINEYMDQIKQIKEQISKTPKQLESKRCVIEENRVPMNIIKEKMEEFRAQKKTPPVTFIKKLKEYQQLVHEYNALLKDFKEKRDQITGLKEEIKDIQDGIFSSKVINHSNWREFNEIKFKLVDPPKEIVYNTRENEIARVLMIKKIENEEGEVDYAIKKSNNIRRV